MAFNAKNLQYNKQEPSFLRKLKGEYGGLDGRSNVQIARPKKDRLKTGDGDEDEPLIVDESGETVEKAEFERRQRQGSQTVLEDGSSTEKAERDSKGGEQQQQQSERQKVTEIGSSANAKKRKVGKVVTSDEVDDQGDGNAEDGQSKTKNAQKPKSEDKDGREVKTPKKDQPKKKGKKIKLSFDDAEG
ncbi:hypothetical protein PV08_02131 [Exophiala spinifera]|uniref:DUF4604 domain-containing protein n=1 Tax=Exophiala spinifera TaxID=91928 RepID=A0A0D1Z1N6_9EURO|nr:uncharacterized protein PV08_02131 [Exophiala spinifera]KIW21551.1 hypothetical protein PV08_02131 [Exophiala spinifera]